MKNNTQSVSETLEKLIGQIKTARTYLQGEGLAELQKSLHDDVTLPDSSLEALASKAIDELHMTQQLLEPGHLLLADHFLGYVSTKCLNSAVELKLVDILTTGPDSGMTVEELAEASGAQPDRLEQILRVLRNNHIFAYEAETRRYRNNRVSKLLHIEHWTQWHNWVDLYGNEFYDIARGIPQSMRKGEDRWAAQINFNTTDNMFTYFQTQGWLPRLHRTLGGGAIAQAPGILADYPWRDVANETVLDVGGGGGGFLASLLREHVDMRGGIFDLPLTIAHAKTLFHELEGTYFDLHDRVADVDLIGGDFLKAVPAFSVYTMKWCLHDWKDDDVVTILRNIRAAIKPGPLSRLVVLESILTDGRSGRLSRYGDINMMMTANGQERSEQQWRNLASTAGWKVDKIYPMRRSWVCAIDLRP